MIITVRKTDVLNTVINSLYPRRCVLCDKVIEHNRFLCSDCMYVPKHITNDACFKCGVRKSKCRCKTVRYHFKAVVAPFWYEDKIRDAFLKFKFNDATEYVDYFAGEMVKVIKRIYDNILFDAIAYVPTTKKQLHSRGYNQCEILANKISDLISVPVEHKALKKLFDNQTQHTLTREERVQNVRNAYASGCDLTGKTVLLIDDIKSSGATLNECAKQLLLGGADTVYCAVALLNSSNSDKELAKPTVKQYT